MHVLAATMVISVNLSPLFGCDWTQNVLMLCQAWRIAHPPVRGKTWLGTRPMVHVGFLKSWLAGGLKLKVVNQVLEAVQQCKQRSGSDHPITVLVTGVQLSAQPSNSSLNSIWLLLSMGYCMLKSSRVQILWRGCDHV